MFIVYFKFCRTSTHIHHIYTHTHPQTQVNKWTKALKNAPGVLLTALIQETRWAVTIAACNITPRTHPPVTAWMQVSTVWHARLERSDRRLLIFCCAKHVHYIFLFLHKHKNVSCAKLKRTCNAEM